MIHYPKQLFEEKNGLSMIDFLVYFYLVENFATKKSFATSTWLWKQIEEHAKGLGLNYKHTSIRSSFYKLVPAELITNEGRAVYSINTNILQ